MTRRGVKDLISRQAAVDVIKELVPLKMENETVLERLNRKAYETALKCAELMIESLPSERAGENYRRQGVNEKLKN